MAKSLLLASFVNKEELYDAIENICTVLNIDQRSLFIFINEENQDEYIITYNLSANNANIKFSAIWKNTISVHRKKQTNTIYSLNAMNGYIKSKNRGILNKEYRVEWEQFENMMMIVKNGQFKAIPLRMVKINQ